jgi:hypothetical protein
MLYIVLLWERSPALCLQWLYPISATQKSVGTKLLKTKEKLSLFDMDNICQSDSES